MIAPQTVKVNTSLIPPVEGRLLGQAFLKGCKKFYEQPENVRDFNSWKAAKEAGQNEN